MAEAFPDRVVPAQIVQQLVDLGRLGQKAGKGFFDYGFAKGGKPPRGGQHAKDQKRSQETVRNASKPVDPDSPFAKLLALKAQLEKRDG
jgi:3-hydroxyacyl-CoA dehydrogenase